MGKISSKTKLQKCPCFFSFLSFFLPSPLLRCYVSSVKPLAKRTRKSARNCHASRKFHAYIVHLKFELDQSQRNASPAKTCAVTCVDLRVRLAGLSPSSEHVGARRRAEAHNGSENKSSRCLTFLHIFSFQLLQRIVSLVTRCADADQH